MANTGVPQYLVCLAEAVILFRRSNNQWDAQETFRKRLQELCHSNWENYAQALVDAEKAVDLVETALAELKVDEAIGMMEESNVLEDIHDNLASDRSEYRAKKLGWVWNGRGLQSG